MSGYLISPQVVFLYIFYYINCQFCNESYIESVIFKK